MAVEGGTPRASFNGSLGPLALSGSVRRCERLGGESGTEGKLLFECLRIADPKACPTKQLGGLRWN